MLIALASDLHLEFKDINLLNTEGADVLILSGDIMIAEDLHDHPEPDIPYAPEIIKILGTRQIAALRFRNFLKRVSSQFTHVIYIAGNHEFYHGKWKQSIDHLREECDRFPNIYFLEQDTKIINGVVFVGGTLWTNCNKGDPLTLHCLTDMMNDFRIIRNDEKGYTKLRPYHTITRHQQTVEYIKFMVSEHKDKKCVVVGHHAPSHLSVHNRYRTPEHSLMNGAYYTDLSDLILDHPQIVLWTHGHMHDPFDYQIGTTRVVCNPRGYGGHDSQADVFELKYLEI